MRRQLFDLGELNGLVIMGIDPGFAITGYGVVKYSENKFSVIDYGVVYTKAQQPFHERLLNLYLELTGIMDKYHPDEIAIEELFFNKNVKTALSAAHGRGVAILAAARFGPRCRNIPAQVKQAVVGYGRASKEQVQQMVRVLLNLRRRRSRMMPPMPWRWPYAGPIPGD